MSGRPVFRNAEGVDLFGAPPAGPPPRSPRPLLTALEELRAKLAEMPTPLLPNEFRGWQVLGRDAVLHAVDEAIKAQRPRQAGKPEAETETCRISGAYQIFSTADHVEQWRDGLCTLPKDHDPALAAHEHYGLRLIHHGRECPCDTCRGSLR